MSEVLLRKYVEEMREHLSEGHFSQVLALGNHILSFYPKHLETYQILGETNLEMNELGAAEDLFNRVRSADPENVVAFIGLSIIHEHRSQIDEAIWHLERAFEIQSSNGELRRELLRLYEARDGAPRERFKLTPGALARLYARQGLYGQAIQEFRALLRAEPDRLDLQLALAEALYHEGRKQESAQLARALLDKLPFCLKANLLLGSLWAENGVPESEMLLKRAHALDPDALMARELQIDHLPEDSAPTLPELQGPAIGELPNVGQMELGGEQSKEMFGAPSAPPTVETQAPTPAPYDSALSPDTIWRERSQEGQAPSAPETPAESEQPLPWLDNIYHSAEPLAPGQSTTGSAPEPSVPWLEHIYETQPDEQPADAEISPPAETEPAAASSTPVEEFQELHLEPEAIAETGTTETEAAEAGTSALSEEPAELNQAPAAEQSASPAPFASEELEASTGGSASFETATESDLPVQTGVGQPGAAESLDLADMPLALEFLDEEQAAVQAADAETEAQARLASQQQAEEITAPVTPIVEPEPEPEPELTAEAPLAIEFLDEEQAAIQKQIPPAPEVTQPEGELQAPPSAATAVDESATPVQETGEPEAEAPAVPEEQAIPEQVAAPVAEMVEPVAEQLGVREEENVEPVADQHPPAVEENVEPLAAAPEAETVAPIVEPVAEPEPTIEEFETAGQIAAVEEARVEQLAAAEEEPAQPVAKQFETPEEPAIVQRAEPAIEVEATSEQLPAWEQSTAAQEEIPVPGQEETVEPATEQARAPEEALVEPAAEQLAAPIEPAAEPLAEQTAAAEPSPAGKPAPRLEEGLPLLAAAAALNRTLPQTRPSIPGALDKLPTWMRAALTRETSGATPATPPPPARPAGKVKTPPVPSAVEPQATLPAWLQQGETLEPDQPKPKPAEELPDWLKGEQPASSTDKAQQEPPAEKVEEALTSEPAETPTSTAPEAAERDMQGPEIPATPTLPISQAAEISETAEELPGPVEPAAAPARAEPHEAEPVRKQGAEARPKAPQAPVAQPSAAPSQAEGKTRLSLDPELLLATAREMVASGNSAGALEYYERALQRGPRFVSTVIGDLEELVKDPNAPLPSHRLLGDAYAMAGRFKDALVQYRWVLNK